MGQHSNPPSLPHCFLCDLEQINLNTEAQFPHLKMEIIVSTRAMARNSHGHKYSTDELSISLLEAVTFVKLFHQLDAGETDSFSQERVGIKTG